MILASVPLLFVQSLTFTVSQQTKLPHSKSLVGLCSKYAEYAISRARELEQAFGLPENTLSVGEPHLRTESSGALENADSSEYCDVPLSSNDPKVLISFQSSSIQKRVRTSTLEQEGCMKIARQVNASPNTLFSMRNYESAIIGSHCWVDWVEVQVLN